MIGWNKILGIRLLSDYGPWAHPHLAVEIQHNQAPLYIDQIFVNYWRNTSTVLWVCNALKEFLTSLRIVDEIKPGISPAACKITHYVEGCTYNLFISVATCVFIYVSWNRVNDFGSDRGRKYAGWRCLLLLTSSTLVFQWSSLFGPGHSAVALRNGDVHCLLDPLFSLEQFACAKGSIFIRKHVRRLGANNSGC